MALNVLDEDKTDRIKAYLRWYPKGQTITNIAKKLEMNRNLVAKYLDMLLISGQLEVQLTGAAKVYTLSHRVPVSAMLEFSSDYVLMLDAEHRILQLNEPLLSFLKTEQNTLLGKAIAEIDHPFFKKLPLMSPENGGEIPREHGTGFSVVLAGETFYFSLKQVPTVFEDGEQGITCIIENITRINRYIKNLEFLARTSAKFADMDDDENIYQYIADSIAELEPKAHVNVMSINPDMNTTTMQATAGNKEITEIQLKYFSDLFQGPVSLEKSPEAFDHFSQGILVPVPVSLYVQTYRMIPEPLCNEIEKSISLKKFYAMGCTCRKGIYGNISLRFQHEDDLTNQETVEAFVRQAGVALQRRYLREKLRKAEERNNVLERSSSHTGMPVAQVANDIRAIPPGSSRDTP